MKWETPSFVEINMSAEIGGYQSDSGDRDPLGPPLRRPIRGCAPASTRRTQRTADPVA